MKKSQDVYRIVSEIPKGKVMTYGQIGKIVGVNPRLVGKILHKNPDPENIPCHRIVNIKGEVALKYSFGGQIIQSKKLVQEGVEFFDGTVNLKKCLYKRNH